MSKLVQKFEDYLDEIFRIIGTKSAEYDMILKCLYNVKPFIYAFVIRHQDLQFFLIGDDVFEVAVSVSKVSIPTHQSGCTLWSFTIPIT